MPVVCVGSIDMDAPGSMAARLFPQCEQQTKRASWRRRRTVDASTIAAISVGRGKEPVMHRFANAADEDPSSPRPHRHIRISAVSRRSATARALVPTANGGRRNARSTGSLQSRRPHRQAVERSGAKGLRRTPRRVTRMPRTTRRWMGHLILEHALLMTSNLYSHSFTRLICPGAGHQARAGPIPVV